MVSLVGAVIQPVNSDFYDDKLLTNIRQRSPHVLSVLEVGTCDGAILC